MSKVSDLAGKKIVVILSVPFFSFDQLLFLFELDQEKIPDLAQLMEVSWYNWLFGFPPEQQKLTDFLAQVSADTEVALSLGIWGLGAHTLDCEYDYEDDGFSPSADFVTIKSHFSL
jgi:hypothetical protein